MNTFNTPLLDQLEDLSDEASFVLSCLQIDGNFSSLSLPREKQFLYSLERLMDSKSNAIWVLTNMKNFKTGFPDTGMLRREINNNMLTLPSASHQDLYKRRIKTVMDR